MSEEDVRAVEAALLGRALGYEVRETVEEESERGVKRRTTLYHIPGDVRAQIFILRNRRPDVWRDKPERETDMEEKGVNIIDDIA